VRLAAIDRTAVLVRVYLQRGAGRLVQHHTAVDVVTDDMPFLVDSSPTS